MLVTVQKQSGPSPLLKRAPNQNITCEKENQPPEGQGKRAAMTSHAPGCDLLMVWRQGDGQGHLKPRRRPLRTEQNENEKRLCVHAWEAPCAHGVQYICYTEGLVLPFRHPPWCRRVKNLPRLPGDQVISFLHRCKITH